MNIGDWYETRMKSKKCRTLAFDNNFFFMLIRWDEHFVSALCCLQGCFYQMQFFKFRDLRNEYESTYNNCLTGINGVHTCGCNNGIDQRKIENSFLEEQLRNVVLKDMDIKVDTLVTMIEEMTGIKYMYNAVYKIKQKIIEKFKFNCHKCRVLKSN